MRRMGNKARKIIHVLHIHRSKGNSFSKSIKLYQFWLYHNWIHKNLHAFVKEGKVL